MRRRTIIDCDPGTDDAVALLLALASPEEIDLLGVTVVGGNVGLERTVANALAVVELAGADVPVFAGAAKPLLRPLVTAAHVHGESGLRGADLPPPSRRAEDAHAADWIRSVLRDAPPASVQVCAVGPLTNLALAFLTEPAIATAVERIVVMGGAIGLGNVTSAAEFNVYVDPHAAQVVLDAGVPVVLVPLDLTHRAIATPERVERIRALGNPAARAVAGILSAYPPMPRFGGEGGPVHDACAAAWLVAPELMTGRSCHVRVDCTDGPSVGRTVVDWWKDERRPNALVLDAIDDEGFFELLTARLGRYGR